MTKPDQNFVMAEIDVREQYPPSCLLNLFLVGGVWISAPYTWVAPHPTHRTMPIPMAAR